MRAQPLRLTITPSLWRIAATTLLSLWLASCAGLGGAASPPSIDRAESLWQRGDTAAAAREFERLADGNDFSAATDFRLRAARAWLAAQRPADARRVLTALDGAVRAAGATLSPAQQNGRQLADIDLALGEGQAQAAWAQLAALKEPRDPAQREAWLELRQRIAIATARPVDAVRAQVAREPLLGTDAARLAARRELFAQLRTASQRGVKLEPLAAERDTVLRGWLELGPIAAMAADRGGAGPALAAWRARYPTHPAADLVRSEFSSSGPTTGFASGAHVAVLLPITGRAAGPAAQIRDGMLAALYATPELGRPEMRVYDTGLQTVAAALDEAQRNGAEFVVGPLTREEVLEAADYSERRPPVLALNFLPGERVPPESFFQYALSPEDDARLVARRMLADGRRRGVALVPEGDWGNRVLAAFTEELVAGGGQLLSSAPYTPGSNDYGGPIQNVLRLSDSRARHRRLESMLGTSLEFQPRRRSDIDFIFAPATASTARMLRPQLRFHFAGDIPTYATSDAFEPGLASNQDLDGLIFPDMPWVLSGGESVEKLRAATTSAFGEGARGRGKLYAFGYDAWLLATALRGETLARSGREGASGVVVDGATGRISFDANGRSRRELEWAQMRGGTPKLLPGGTTSGTSGDGSGGSR